MNLNTFMDASIVLAGINLVNTVANIYWTLRLKAIQGNKEIMQDLTSQNQAKDEIIKSLKNERRQLRYQYNQALADKVHLQGELKTYHNIHQLPIAQQ